MDTIEFGTDGWRDVIGDRFTCANVARVAQAYANHLLDMGTPSVMIGYDTRFNAECFARVVAEVMAASGVEARLSTDYLPTPALSFAVKHYGAGGGVMLTASHNPPEYLGFKLKGPYGGTATHATYEQVSARLPYTSKEAVQVYDPRRHGYARFDVREAYYEALASLVDLGLLRAFRGSLVYDAMGGAGASWLRGFVDYAGLNLELHELRAEPSSSFYGVHPEPIPKNLALTTDVMRGSTAVFAAATDGDADRLGLVLPGGDYFNSHQIFAVLLDHLSRKGLAGRVVKTFTVSRIIERLAAARGLLVVETPVGFKYIVNAMLEGDVLIGGEESGGIGENFHLPERDGLANTLLMLEAVLSSGRSVAELFSTLEQDAAWRHAYDRLDLNLDSSHLKNEVLARLKTPPSFFARRRVTSVERLDGTKLNLSGDAWLLFRASGTEPLLRIYCEAPRPETVQQLLAEAQTFVKDCGRSRLGHSAALSGLRL